MRSRRLLLLLLLLAASTSSGQDVERSTELWSEILGKPEGSVPADPGGDVTWRSDFYAALDEAQTTNRPMLVTWRCIPCKQCAEFDKDVLEGSDGLDPLLRRFVTVRMIDASQLDERYFPYQTHQDLDLSWWGYFLRPDGALYGVFGGKDHVSDSTRISEAALINSLTRVLQHHYDPRRAKWDADGPKPDPSAVKVGPKDSPGYRLLAERFPAIKEAHPELGSCVHCHQVGDMQTMESLAAGDFHPDQLLQKWPLPENVGIELDRDDGLLVTSVSPGSAASAAGLRSGDQLGMADGVRLFGQADFRGVLHRVASGSDTITLAWTRDGKLMTEELSLAPGWRVTENSWRKTVYDGVYGPGMGFFPLNGPKAGKGEGLSIKPWMGRPPSDRPIYQTGLRPDMEIIAIDDMSDDMETRQLITWFRFHHKAGDEVTYRVRGGKEFKYVLPKPSSPTRDDGGKQ